MLGSRAPSAARASITVIMPAVAFLLSSAQLAEAEGKVESGKAVFEHKCAVCHTTIPEYHKEGPSLAGVYGRQAGKAPFFAGYKGLRGSQLVWDEHTLDTWLADPRTLLGGKNTAMTLRLEDATERADVIAYLKTLR